MLVLSLIDSVITLLNDSSVLSTQLVKPGNWDSFWMFPPLTSAIHPQTFLHHPW